MNESNIVSKVARTRYPLALVFNKKYRLEGEKYVNANIDNKSRSFNLSMSVSGYDAKNYSFEIASEKLIIKAGKYPSFLQTIFPFVYDYSWEILLPRNADIQNMNAKFDGGCLLINLPKK